MNKRAYAKINLGLKVISKRADGYHNLEMIMVKIGLYDELMFSKSNDIEVVCENIEMKKNLVYRIALYLKSKYNIKEGIKIVIKKRIPMDAGIGGGSSDAACTINALNKIWKLRMNLEERKKIANHFGSDIAFFIDGKPSFVSGIGEKIRKIEFKNNFNVLIVKPSFGCSTKQIFTMVNSFSSKGELLILEDALKNGDINLVSKNLVNDLEHALKKDERFKEIDKIKKDLIKNGANGALMSGSGSCVFGLFSDKKVMEEAYKYFKNQNYEIYMSKTIG